MTQLPARAEVVVVGAGLAGASTAFMLAERGVRPLVLDAARRVGASGRSASIVRSDVADETLWPLVWAGAALLASGRLAPFRRVGGFVVGAGEDDLAERFAGARGRGRFRPADGVVDAQALLRTLLAPVDVIEDATVVHLEREPGCVRVVLEDGSSVRAPVVVNAAGAWAGTLGGLPLQPRKRHLFRSLPGVVDPGGPWAWHDAEGLYFRPEPDGALLACPCDETPVAPGDDAVDPAVEQVVRDKLALLQPGLPPFEVAARWAGQRTFAPDGRFVIGWDPRLEGLFWVAGLGGHGVTASAAVGAFAAVVIGAGPDAGDGGEAFSPARLT